MNVNDFDRYISNYLDGELNSSKTKEFEELLNNHAECNEKFISYKKMLNELSNLESIKTSEDFLDKLYQRINNVNSLDDMPLQPKTIFGYNYIAISGIAAAFGIFMFSVSVFIGSESLPLFNLDKLSAKNTQQKIDQNFPSNNLVAEEDSSMENQNLDLPKIHLVGGKK